MNAREQFVKPWLILLDSSPVSCPTWGKSDVLKRGEGWVTCDVPASIERDALANTLFTEYSFLTAESAQFLELKKCNRSLIIVMCKQDDIFVNTIKKTVSSFLN